MSYEPIDLERMDERAEDLGHWASGDEEAQARARDEHEARAALRPLASGVHITRAGKPA